jgi:hypothetical protein
MHTDKKDDIQQKTTERTEIQSSPLFSPFAPVEDFCFSANSAVESEERRFSDGRKSDRKIEGRKMTDRGTDGPQRFPCVS